MTVDKRADEARFGASLVAPKTVEFLNGRGLGEVLQQFVIADPEVAALIDRAGMQDRFDEGQCPLRLSDCHWPLDVTTSNFEYRLTEGAGILAVGGPERRPSQMVSALSLALVNRLGCLRELLISGRVEAWGFTPQYVETQVPARLWARKNLSIDVTSGDLCEEDDGGRYSTLWTSVELRTAPIKFDRLDGPVEPQAGARKRSAKGQEVERLMREHRINAEQLGPKDAAAAVAQRMGHPPRSAAETKALEKLVARISKDVHRGA